MYLKRKLKIFFILLSLILYFQILNAIENKILFKIDNEIITTLDIYEEIKFLKAFNPETNYLDENELFEISKNSIQKNIIKKIELNKFVEELKVDDKFLSKLIVNKYSKIGIDSLEKFEAFSKDKNLDIKLIKEKFYIELISENEFILTTNLNNVNLFDMSTETFISNKDYDFNYEGLHKFGEKIITDFFSFTISKNDLSLFKDEDWVNYFFVVSSYNDLTKNYLKNLKILEIEKDASILKISLEGSNPLKINDFLNKFTELYLALDLDEKNQITSNTIQFINEQLVSISDSLSNVESSLETFKEINPKIELSFIK